MVLQYYLHEKMPKIDIRGYWDYTDWQGGAKFIGAERVNQEVKDGDTVWFKGNRYRVIHVSKDGELGRIMREKYFHVYVLLD